MLQIAVTEQHPQKTIESVLSQFSFNMLFCVYFRMYSMHADNECRASLVESARIGLANIYTGYQRHMNEHELLHEVR